MLFPRSQTLPMEKAELEEAAAVLGKPITIYKLNGSWTPNPVPGCTYEYSDRLYDQANLGPHNEIALREMIRQSHADNSVLYHEALLACLKGAQLMRPGSFTGNYPFTIEHILAGIKPDGNVFFVYGYRNHRFSQE